jgi:hypothetical protein
VLVDSIDPKDTPTPSEMNVNSAAHRIVFVCLSILSFVSSPVVNAQAQAHEEFICTFGSDKRVVSLVKTNPVREPKACRVDYTRSGRTTTVWTSKTGYAYCAAKAASLVTKLAEGHYSCKPQSVGTPDESKLQRQIGSSTTRNSEGGIHPAE